jgi:hypothetical protein
LTSSISTRPVTLRSTISLLFEVLGDIWEQLQVLKSAYPQDRFLTGLTVCLERQLVAAGLVLTIQAELLTRR